MRKPTTAHENGIRVWDDTDPAAIEPAVAALLGDSSAHAALELPLPEATITAAAAALKHRPEVRLIVGGRVWDRPGLSLDWLEEFPHLRSLGVSVYDALDLSPIRHLHDLRRLHVGETKRRSLSLAFLSETPRIEELSIDGTGGRDFDAVATLDRLRIFTLRAARTKTLDPLRGHPTLEGVTVTLGGIRDLTPLATIPNLRALDLWGIRLLDTDDFDAIGDCHKLGGLSLGALGHIRNLAALARGPAKTLRFLMLENMKGLETLSHLAECKRLEEVFWTDVRPSDGQLDIVAALPPDRVHFRMRTEEYLALL